MGINELIMTLNFASISLKPIDALLNFLSFYIPFINVDNVVTARSIYGLSEDINSGVGMDVFSNYWIKFSGSTLLYVIGMSSIGWMMGKILFVFNKIFLRYRLEDLIVVIFIILFLLFIEGRASLFIYILALSYAVDWILRKKFIW
jgi:hypothetical protein